MNSEKNIDECETKTKCLATLEQLTIYLDKMYNWVAGQLKTKMDDIATTAVLHKIENDSSKHLSMNDIIPLQINDIMQFVNLLYRYQYSLVQCYEGFLDNKQDIDINTYIRDRCKQLSQLQQVYKSIHKEQMSSVDFDQWVAGSGVLVGFLDDLYKLTENTVIRFKDTVATCKDSIERNPNKDDIMSIKRLVCLLNKLVPFYCKYLLCVKKVVSEIAINISVIQNNIQ